MFLEFRNLGGSSVCQYIIVVFCGLLHKVLVEHSSNIGDSAFWFLGIHGFGL